MNYNKRIWKTGALAVAATMIFAVFVFRAAEWSKGLTSEFLVLGQGGTTWTGPSGGTTKVIPQVAVGSFDGGLTRYATAMEIVNTNSTPVTVSANFYKEDGSAASLTLATNLAAVPTISSGVLSPVALAAGQALVITGGFTAATTPATGALGWGKIVTNGTVIVSTFFELRDGTGKVLYSRVGVPSSPPDMASFLVPRIRNVAAGLDVAFALVNTGSSQVLLNATLKDASGATIATRNGIVMGPRSHQAIFAQQLFGLSNEPRGMNYHYIVFDSASASFAAIALAFEGGTQTSFPVERIR